MPPLSPPQTAYGLVYVGDPNVGKEQKRKAYSAADRSFADNDRKKKRSKRKNKKCTKGCYVLRVCVAPYVTPLCNTLYVTPINNL